MDAATVIRLGVTVSIALTVFALGLRTAGRDVAGFLRRPELLVRSVLAMNVIMPLLAVVIALAFRLEPAVTVALIALSLAPVPPILPRKQLSVSDDEPYVLGLLTVGSAVSVVLAPLILHLIGRLFDRELTLEPAGVAGILMTTVFVPLAAGQLVHRISPSFARQVEPWASRVAGALLAMTALALIATVWRGMWTLVGNGTLLAMVGFAAAGLVVGHLLGGPDAGSRAVLALATASRHPGVAIALATTAVQVRSVGAAVLLYTIVSTLVSAPYARRRRRRDVATHSLASPRAS